MTLSALLKDYDSLRNALPGLNLGEGLPELKPCGLNPTEPIRYQNPEEVWSHIESFKPDQGWICFQSSVEHFFEPNKLIQKGIVLTAEMCRKDNQSLHINPHSLGGWQVNQFERRDDAEEYLYQKVKYVSVEHGIAYLHYELFWQSDSQAGMVCRVARFVGFSLRTFASNPNQGVEGVVS